MIIRLALTIVALIGATATAQPFGKKEHTAAAVDKAETYFTYEYNKHANGTVTVRTKVEVDRCEPIQGWRGEWRTTGTAYMTYLNPSGVSMRNDTCRFEVVTKEVDDAIKATSITPKT